MKRDVTKHAQGQADGWWQKGGWKESPKQPVSANKKLERYFNPKCEGKHDRTTHDIVICPDCFTYTTKLQGETDATTV